jgi:hypothetical protein
MNHPDPSTFTGFLPNDALHPALRPILELIGRDAGPVILDTVADFERWADAQPADGFDPPRAISFHRTRLRGVDVQRYTSSYTLWMLQRPLDAYRSLGERERAAVDEVLAGTGCEAILSYRPRHRVDKHNYRLRARRHVAP